LQISSNFLKKYNEICNAFAFNEADYALIYDDNPEYLRSVKTVFDKFDFNEMDTTIYGEIYEQASDKTKNPTRFYTPDSYAVRLTREVCAYKFGSVYMSTDERIAALKCIKIFDPACGSGALLIKAARHLKSEWDKIATVRYSYIAISLSIIFLASTKIHMPWR
jgi:type I restriction-modification system DNA methylase subunit